MPAYRGAALRCAVLIAGVGACAHPSRSSLAPAGGAASCLLAPASRPPLSARSPLITVALTDSVDPNHAPVPRNDPERLVFPQLYEPLVRFDCEGRAVPGLAESWTSSDGGRRWAFTLRADAQFWDGAPVTAQDIVFGRSGPGYTLAALETRVVTVMLARPQDAVPTLLGDPGLAITKPAPDSSWPIGTGRYWATAGTTTAQEVRAQSSAGDTIVFRLAPNGDARDLLDAGVDLLITRDRALRDYAATLPNLTLTSLPWDRTYVLVTPEAGGTRLDGLEQSVRAEARRPEPGFWWLDLRACGTTSTTSPPAPPTGTQRRVLYTRSDPTARELAGRLAALTRGVAVARTADEFATALAQGRDWGYVTSLPRFVADPCRIAALRLPGWSATVTALVDTRATAIVRRGVARWGVDQDGTVHLVP